MENEKDYSIYSGTLNVVLGNQNCIIVASDSRLTRSQSNGDHYTDDCKKLFLLGKQRALAIAGLAGASVLADSIRLQIPDLIEKTIQRCGDSIDFHDNRRWNNIASPPDLPEEFRDSWQDAGYFWWNAITGSMCLLTDICATHNQDVVNRLSITGLHAGYKENGEIKIEKLTQVPVERTSNWGRKTYLMYQTFEYRTSQAFIWATSGQVQLSDLVLNNSPNELIKSEIENFPSFSNYFNRYTQNSRDEMTEQELVGLATDLIKFTANFKQSVGSHPIQIAVLKKNEPSTITADNNFARASSIRAAGLSGCVYTSDYPFNECVGTNFVNCVIENNTIPIPIDQNFFYGGEFKDVTFSYNGGPIFFGKNNKLEKCFLKNMAHNQSTELTEILNYYSDQLKLIH